MVKAPPVKVITTIMAAVADNLLVPHPMKKLCFFPHSVGSILMSMCAGGR
jgi:hypothetical protein